MNRTRLCTEGPDNRGDDGLAYTLKRPLRRLPDHPSVLSCFALEGVVLHTGNVRALYNSYAIRGARNRTEKQHILMYHVRLWDCHRFPISQTGYRLLGVKGSHPCVVERASAAFVETAGNFLHLSFSENVFFRSVPVRKSMQCT